MFKGIARTAWALVTPIRHGLTLWRDGLELFGCGLIVAAAAGHFGMDAGYFVAGVMSLLFATFGGRGGNRA